MFINFKAVMAMFKAMDKAGLGKAFLEFLKRNEGTLVYGAGAVALSAMAKKCDLPLRDAFAVYNSKGNILDFDEFQSRNSPKDAAISALTDSASETFSSSEMIQAVKGIRDLVASGETDKSTMSYAVRCLNKIADGTYSSSVKSEVQKAILDIGKRG